MNFTFNLPKGNWTESQYRNRRGGITKKYRTPNGLSFTFNLEGKPQPRSKGQGRCYHQHCNHKKRNRNFRGGKHPRNNQRWRQYKRNSQQQKAQRAQSQFHETVSPSDFQSWEPLTPMSMSQGYTWQPSTSSTPPPQHQVEDEYPLHPPEKRKPQRVPSQFHETLGPRDFRYWDRLDCSNQGSQDHQAWQQPTPVTPKQQHQSDTGRVLDQVIEKMRQEHQSQTQLEQVRAEKQRQLQQYIDGKRREYQLAGQDKQFNQQGTDTHSSCESSRSPTLSAASGIDEDDESVIFNRYRYL
ncbi:hypothetical protein SI65_09931 [Aspergillus cristatus]|uniref:Uncharacterized protein n=1 Tax=Aspergillus cristatus TaxID=573508 RepID=A0A1E3B299_ASPCR|nr:hypothetical protein SI65_09931 [Aspergillus cristatus]